MRLVATEDWSRGYRVVTLADCAARVGGRKAICPLKRKGLLYLPSKEP
jgi:hypothetical protein